MRYSVPRHKTAFGVFAGLLPVFTAASCDNDVRRALESHDELSGPDGGSLGDDCPEGSAFSAAGATEPPECMPCAVGTYCQGGRAKPRPCPEGTWDHDADPATRCEPWANCEVGEYVLVEGSESRDRQCLPCAEDGFSLQANAPECSPVSECAEGSYVRVTATSTRDQICADCPVGSFSDEPNLDACERFSDCEPGQYVSEPGSGVADRTCETCPEGEFSTGANAATCVAAGECEAGTFEVRAASAIEPADCAPCEAGHYCAGGGTAPEECTGLLWDDDADPATPCSPARQCQPGSFVAARGTALTDQECEPCAAGTYSAGANAASCIPHQTCEPGTYLAAPGTSSSDADCNGCASGSFSAAADVASCTPFTDCAAGQFVSVEGSASADRGCEACPEGTYSEGVNSGSCVELGQCLPGQVEIAPGSESTPAECEDCNAGEFCAGGDSGAEPCGGEVWDHDGDPATPCAAKTACVPGQYVAAEGDALSDQSCAACDAGQFSADVNSDGCLAWTACEPGSYVAVPGTSSNDQGCSVCPDGSFSASPNAPSCAVFTTCSAPTRYESAAPSSTSDRSCGTCQAPEVTLEDNATECIVPVFQMSGGRAVLEAEHFHGQTLNDSAHRWELAAEPLASGGQCMRVNPDVAYSWTSPVGFAPQLEFRVEFTNAATYYIHLRGDAGDGGGGADSVFAAIDAALTPVYDFDDQADQWGWRTHGISIGTAGQRLVSIWPSEDGFCLDKIVISTSSTPPTGDGPAESPQQ